MGESTQTGYSRPLMQNQDKTMTQAFHLEADNIPVTFPGKCPGLDRFIWLAGDTAQETRWGVGVGGPAFPLYAKECPCERWKSSDKKKYLQISCFYLRGVPDGWSLPQSSCRCRKVQPNAFKVSAKTTKMSTRKLHWMPYLYGTLDWC